MPAAKCHLDCRSCLRWPPYCRGEAPMASLPTSFLLILRTTLCPKQHACSPLGSFGKSRRLQLHPQATPLDTLSISSLSGHHRPHQFELSAVAHSRDGLDGTAPPGTRFSPLAKTPLSSTRCSTAVHCCSSLAPCCSLLAPPLLIASRSYHQSVPTSRLSLSAVDHRGI